MNVVDKNDIKKLVKDYIYKESKLQIEKRIKDWFYDKNEVDSLLKRYEK